MAWAGNYSANQTVYLPFPSTDASGTPYELANGTVTCYRLGNTTEFSNNITLNATWDSRPGFNLLTIETSLNADFTPGFDYSPVLTVGDCNGTSVANMTLDWFSIENRHLGTAAQATQLSTANTTIQTANTTIVTANTTITAANATIDTANTTITAANTTLNTANTTISEANTTITSANVSVSAMNTTINGVSGIDHNTTLKQGMRICIAAAGGQLAGAGTSTVTLKNQSANATVITATVDAGGNRTLVTYNTTY